MPQSRHHSSSRTSRSLHPKEQLDRKNTSCAAHNDIQHTHISKHIKLRVRSCAVGVHYNKLTNKKHNLTNRQTKHNFASCSPHLDQRVKAFAAFNGQLASTAFDPVMFRVVLEAEAESIGVVLFLVAHAIERETRKTDAMKEKCMTQK